MVALQVGTETEGSRTGVRGRSPSPRLRGHHCQRIPPGCRILAVGEMESLFRLVGRPASFCRRRPLFSAFSAHGGSSSSLSGTRASGKWPTSIPFPVSPRRACSSIARMSSSTPHPEYRLPPNAKPHHYDLIIRTDLENQTFAGFVAVQYAADLI